MKGTAGSALMGALSLAASVQAAPKLAGRDVDTRFPYTGPTVPVGDWVDPSINGNGKGFPRLVEAPAVTPATANPTNNINVISMSYIPGGINIHFQTPFGIGAAPTVKYGPSATNLNSTATGSVKTYLREPPCSAGPVTQCSEFFYDVSILGLAEDTQYHYLIPGGNGTTPSSVLSFATARAAGNTKPFSVAVLNDMGYTNAAGTHSDLIAAANGGVAFAWHGGDISYADDWYSGILPCESDWPVCINGTATTLPSSPLQPAPVPAEYLVPLPAGEKPNQGGPQGGDISVIYESNWDLWQQWMNNITTKIPYMVLPGNHEAACAEFDGPNNELTAYLNNDEANSTSKTSDLTYYSCPPTQRNFTAFQNRFTMEGAQNGGGVSNFWYSFDYGMAHFISLDGETDYAQSPEYPFVADVGTLTNETLPTEEQTFVTDSGPFGYINGSYTNNAAFEQVNWLAKDLAAVNRTKTPWIIAMSHRPMYSSEVSSYQKHMRAAFEGIMLQYNVDAYMSGHIHWYERMWPIGNNTIDMSSVINNNTYLTNPGKTIAHIVNGAAGNIESHSTINATLNITAYLDQVNYGFTQLNFVNTSTLVFEYHHGSGTSPGAIGDTLTLIKRPGAVTKVSSSTSVSGNPSTVVASNSVPTSCKSNSAGYSSLIGGASGACEPATTPASTLASTTGSAKPTSSASGTVAPVSGSSSTKASSSTVAPASGSSTVKATSSASATISSVAGSSSSVKASSSAASGTVAPISASSSTKASSSAVSGTVAPVSGSSSAASTHSTTITAVSSGATCAAPSTVTAPASTVYVTVTAGASSSKASSGSAQVSVSSTVSAPVSLKTSSASSAVSSAVSSVASSVSSKASSASSVAPSTATGSAASSKASSASSSAAAPTASSCGTTLSPAYLFPHLIVPVSSAAPTTAFGTQYFAGVNATFSSIFNFDIPTSDANKMCTLNFFLPEAKDLVTSSYNITGSSVTIDFEQLSGAATQGTTFANQPAVAKDLGSHTLAPGSSVSVASGPCAAGGVVSYELKAASGSNLYYFQDYNNPSLGLYVTVC